MLAAWARILFPMTFDMGYAASAPIPQLQADKDQFGSSKSINLNFDKQMSDVLGSYEVSAVDNMQKALNTPLTAATIAQLRICPGKISIDDLNSWFVDSLSFAAMMNYP